MAFAFLSESPLEVFRKIERDLAVSYPDFNLTPYKSMSAKKLFAESNKLKAINRGLYESNKYASWFTNEKYLRNKLLSEAFEALAEYKKLVEAKEVLVAGFTYYTGVKQFGNTLVGKRCTYLGEGRPAQWVGFRDNVAVRKAFEVIRHGDLDDFREIYVKRADGLMDSMINVSERHIVESSKEALKDIETYCEARWEGPWPWEMKTPFKLKNMIEEDKEMRVMEINEMRNRFNDLLVQLNEGEIEKAQVIIKGQEIVEKLQGMIEDLGKLAGEGILQLKDMARTAIGDEAASSIEQAITQPLNQAADVLSKLKVQVDKCVQGLSNEGQDDFDGFDDGGGAGGDMNMDGGDEMSPEHDSMVNQATDQFDTSGERPKKFESRRR